MANATITGTVIVRVDGRSIRSKAGAKLMLGGEERTPQYADGQLVGFSSKPIATTITCTLAHTSSSDLIALRDIVDSTLVFETDNGVRFICTNSFLSKPPELVGGEGDVNCEFIGQPSVES